MTANPYPGIPGVLGRITYTDAELNMLALNRPRLNAIAERYELFLPLRYTDPIHDILALSRTDVWDVDEAISTHGNTVYEALFISADPQPTVLLELLTLLASCGAGITATIHTRDHIQYLHAEHRAGVVTSTRLVYAEDTRSEALRAEGDVEASAGAAAPADDPFGDRE